MTDQMDLTDLRRELDSAGISDLDGLLHDSGPTASAANRPPKRSSPTPAPARYRPPPKPMRTPAWI